MHLSGITKNKTLKKNANRCSVKEKKHDRGVAESVGLINFVKRDALTLNRDVPNYGYRCHRPTLEPSVSVKIGPVSKGQRY